MTTPSAVSTDDYIIEVLVDEQVSAIELVSGTEILLEVDTVVIQSRVGEEVSVELVNDLVLVGEGGAGGGIPDSEKAILVAAVTWDGIGTAPARPVGYNKVRWCFPADKNPVEFTDTRVGDYWEFVQTEEASP